MKRLCVSVVILTLCAAPAWAQQFGGALAISGDQVLVGETGNQNLPGIVYVFQGQSGRWTEAGQLMVAGPADPPDGFGRALAADGGTLYVGAPLDGGGAVHIYARDSGDNWRASGQISPSDVSDDDRFGSSIVAAGNMLITSAPGQSEGRGAIYVFRRSTTGWEQASKVTPADLDEGAAFGSALALGEDVLLVATQGRRDASAEVYAYEWSASGETFMDRGKVVSEGLDEQSGFGSSIAVHNGLVLVGAPNLNQRTGGVIAFRFDAESDTFVAQRVLAPFDGGANTRFGASITFDGEDVLIGAPGAAEGVGVLYAYQRDATGDFSSVSKITSSELPERASLGSAMYVAGDLAVVGASGVDGRAGAAVPLERTDAGEWRVRNHVINEMRGLPGITGAEVECAEGHIAAFECNEVNVVSFLPLNDMGGARGTRTNDIWGWTDPETGTEYAIVGRSDGTSFVDLSDPFNPVFVGDLPKTPGSRSSVWRDMKVYRDHVYIVADGADEHGVQVFDLAQLRAVRNPPVVFEPDYTYDGIHSAHNIVINEETGHAYAVGNSGGGETCGGGLHMLSLEDPGRPTFVGCFADATTGRRKTGYSHDAQCVRYRGPDAEHQGKEICLGSNETALSISDVTDKANPIALAAVSYPNVAYTHQGWLTEDHRYFYMNDEGDEPQGLVAGTRTLVWDVTDLDDPVLVNEHIATTTTTDHNLYVRGNLMYQSNYGSGLRVLDVSDPVNPIEVGYFDTTPYGGSGSWSNYPFFESGLVIVTSGSEGLFVLKPTSRPVLIP